MQACRDITLRNLHAQDDADTLYEGQADVARKRKGTLA